MNFNEVLHRVLTTDNSAFFYTPPIYKKCKSYLFLSPAEIVETSSAGEIQGKLDKISSLLAKGYMGYGFMSYELGYLFENKFSHLIKDEATLLKFCFCRKKDIVVFKSTELSFGLWDEGQCAIGSFSISVEKERYIRDLNRIKEYIAGGDTYQVNYTVNGTFDFSGNPAELFKKLIFNQSSRYSAIINSGGNIIISLSPELFFKTKKEHIIATPMKGTMFRGINTEDDSARELLLKQSEKNRAENLMIVDLMRNDLGKISKYGSVKVKDLFKIEKYETLFQKISAVESTLKKKITFADIIKNIFPCGSITGAPKIRTMEIISELEKRDRGIYTGAIGLIKKNKAVFNVAIRTIVLNQKTGKGDIGIGSGIVWDSDPDAEFEETLLKSNFLTRPLGYFEIFETMLVEKGAIFLLEKHLKRLKSAASYFLFRFNKKKLLKLLSGEISKLKPAKKYRLKLLLNKWGGINCLVKEYIPADGEIHITISAHTISSRNSFQYFKTTNRALYDSEYERASANGFYDIIFLNEKGQVCEGSRTNIFIKKGSKWKTPPVNGGLLPGVFRNYWMKKNPQIKEAVIYPDDLLAADEIFLTNSLRGIVKVDKLLK